MKGAFGFDSALLILKAGGRVKRLSWKESWIQIMPGYYELDAAVSLPEFLQKRERGWEPWTPSALDMLSDDWTAEHKEDLPHGI